MAVRLPPHMVIFVLKHFLGDFYPNDILRHIVNFYRKEIDLKGYVFPLAGGLEGFQDGSDSKFNFPYGICIDNQGNIFVADTYNHRIRKIFNSIVSTFAGNTLGFEDGSVEAKFYSPRGICLDNKENIYVADTDNHKIRKISNGIVSTIAGSIQGFQDGLVSKFYNPHGICSDNKGYIYVADTSNHKIRRISDGGVITIAGSSQGFQDGSSAQSKFNHPVGVCCDNQGNIYVADTYNHRIRKIKDNVVITISCFRDRDFPQFIYPVAICSDNNGVVYVVDTENHRIRKIINGSFETVIEQTQGFPPDESIAHPTGICFDNCGNLIVTDCFSHRVRLIQ